jgi:hypothetical protein
VWQTSETVPLDKIANPVGTKGTCVEVTECNEIPTYLCDSVGACSVKDKKCVPVDCTLYDDEKVPY